MIKIKHTILIKASPKKVWSIFSSLKNWTKLSSMYKYAKHISGKPWRINSKFGFSINYGIIKTKSVTKILHCNPPKEVTWIGTKPFIKGKHTFIFKKLNNHTEVINYEEFTGVGSPLLVFLNIKPKIEKSFEIFLKGLKKESEKR